MVLNKRIGVISDLFHEQLGLGFFFSHFAVVCTAAGLFVDDDVLPG